MTREELVIVHPNKILYEYPTMIESYVLYPRKYVIEAIAYVDALEQRIGELELEVKSKKQDSENVLSWNECML